MSGNHPVVLCIGGHDPSGGAGIQADAEAVRAAGAWPCTVASCLTTQSTCGVEKVLPQPPEQILDQCRLVLEDSEVRACKIGLIGSAKAGLALGELLAEMRGVPVILDPVLASGSGDRLASSAIVEVLRETLLGRCTLVTPNLPEARALSGLRTPEECSRDLLARAVPGLWSPEPTMRRRRSSTVCTGSTAVEGSGAGRAFPTPITVPAVLLPATSRGWSPSVWTCRRPPSGHRRSRGRLSIAP